LNLGEQMLVDRDARLSRGHGSNLFAAALDVNYVVQEIHISIHVKTMSVRRIDAASACGASRPLILSPG
jgi:hypothetical protein